jgi:ribosome biogenesis GTPase / thiamine phosphate phosphatase
VDSASFNGLVIAHLGKSLAVEAADGQTVVCHSRRHITDVAVGDRVRWEGCDGGLGLVLEVLPRRTALVRPARGGKLRTVASNIDRVWIVIAPEPEPDFLLVDQILAVCAHRGIDAGLLLNKTDLLPRSGAIEAALDAYRAAGYRVLAASARMASGLGELRTALGHVSSMLAGQSGVGKSSLTNALLPDKSLRVNELSRKSRLGRHTTTAATLYHLPDGGELIDSPGVTVFGLAGMSRRDIAEGFLEFREFLDGCQFTDCSHLQDKGCAVREAVEQGRINGERYGRYCRLLDKTLSAAFFSGSGEN